MESSASFEPNSLDSIVSFVPASIDATIPFGKTVLERSEAFETKWLGSRVSFGAKSIDSRVSCGPSGIDSMVSFRDKQSSTHPYICTIDTIVSFPHSPTGDTSVSLADTIPGPLNARTLLFECPGIDFRATLLFQFFQMPQHVRLLKLPHFF